MGSDLSSLELTLVRGFLVLLYAPIVWLTFRRLFPRLLPTAKWLAFVMLAAQVVAILASLEIRSDFTFDVWLLHLNGEYNFPATLASAQLFTVACAAFLMLRPGCQYLASQRVFILVVGLLFALFGWDEAFLLHEGNTPLQVAYIMLGMVLALAAFMLAFHAPWRSRVWYACLVGGMALAGFGAIVVEQVLHLEVCKTLGFLSHNDCLWRYHVEESLEFIGVWLALVAVLGLFSQASPAPSRLVRLALCLLPALVVLLLIESRSYGYIQIPHWTESASVKFDSGLHIYGYRIESNGDTSLVAHLPRGVSEAGLGYSIHLLDQGNGRSVASVDRRLIIDLDRKLNFSAHDYRPLYHQHARVRPPADFPANRALWVLLTHWREQNGGFHSQQIVSSDLHLFSDTQVILGEMVLPAISAPAASPPLARFDNGFLLEAADLPDSVIVGDPLSITFAWRSDVAGTDDLSQFLHFVYVSPPGEGESVEEGAESVASGEWFVYDQSPLGARLPTRLWYAGLADSETWHVPLPADLAPGRYSVFTGLYRVSNLERVPVADADGMPWLDNRVSLGFLHIE